MILFLPFLALLLALNTVGSERHTSVHTTEAVPHGSKEVPSRRSSAVKMTDRPNAYVCAIAMLEDDYIQEWVKYHLLIGFDHIFIYDNNHYEDSTDPTLGNVTRSLPHEFPGKVTVYPYAEHGKNMQMQVYTELAHSFQSEDTYLAMLDVDDYLVLGEFKCIQDLLKAHAYEGRKTLAFVWIHFGSNGHVVHEKRPLAERFQYRAERANQFVKVIVYCPDLVTMHTPHWAELVNGTEVYDTLGNVVEEGRPAKRIHTQISVHHFATKSLQEYEQKLARGEATRNRRDMKYFYHIGNMSVVHDNRVHVVEQTYTQDTCRA